MLPLSAGAQNSNPEAEAHYQNGIKSKNLNEKIKYFEKAVELQPGFLDAIYQLGVTYFQKTQYAAAIQHLGNAVELSNGEYKESKLYLRNAYTFHAVALNESGQAESAVPYAVEATKLDESFAPAYATLGQIQFNLQNWEAAQRAFDQSLKLNPNQEEVWSKLGDIYFRSEAYPLATVTYERALSLDPNLKEAQVHLKIAMKRATPPVWISASEKLQSEGRADDAIALVKRAVTIYPDDAGLIRKMQELHWETDYFAANHAITAGYNQQAKEILMRIDPGYKDVAQRLTEVDALITAQNDTLTKEVAKKSVKPARSQSRSENRDEPSQKSVRQTEDKEISETSSTFVLQKAEGDSSSRMAADDLVAANANESPAVNSDTVNSISVADNHTLSVDQKIPADRFSMIHWIAAGLSGLLLMGLVFIKFGRPTLSAISSRVQHWQKSRHVRQRPSDNTVDFFKDRVASVTPVKFESLDNSNTANHRKSRSKMSSAKNREDLRLEETQTILGGIKKIRRIGRYILEKEIGRGTMGLIYKAWDPKLDRTVAIKQVVFDAINSLHEVSTLKDRLFREARAAGRLNHPNIVIIYDVDEDKNFSYIVMEYLPGKDLKLLLEKEIRFDLARTINIVSQICSALDYAHQMGIVHRDIKPSNIILTQNNHVKVADFGIAKLPHFGTLTQTGSIIGTPYYMSPEQIEGRKLDGRSDLFSVGVILYEMLSGAHPFSGDNIPSVVYKIVHQQPKPPSAIREDLPKSLDEIVRRALTKDLLDRYATALDLIVDLESVQGELLKNEV